MVNGQNLPDPPTSADCDLRDFPFTPLFRARLFGSSFHARASDGEWRAGVTLWLKSWDQVPAGSLPDDDIDLCRLAELGRDVKTWRKVRAMALHGWSKCSDGRLYHAVVAEGIAEAWNKRSSAKRKGIAGASKRWGSATVTDSTGNAPAIAQAMPGDSKRSRREVEVKGKGESNPAVEIPPTATARANGSHPGSEKSGKGKKPEWQTTGQAIAATAETFGIERRRGEDDEAFLDRIQTAIDAKRTRDEADASKRQALQAREEQRRQSQLQCLAAMEAKAPT